MARKKSSGGVAARAERVMFALIAIEQMATATRLESSHREVDAGEFARSVWEVAAGVERDACAVAEVLKRSRVVSFRVIE